MRHRGPVGSGPDDPAVSGALRKVGLSRALSKLAYCSRSRAVELIRAGNVRLNGATQRNPESGVRLGKDRIEVNDAPISARSKVYLMINKPRGVVTTASDEKGRDTVYSCLPEGLPWLAPVGRLDKASEGLLLLTNDSGWASRIASPETHLDKTYHVQIAAQADEELLCALRRGLQTGDGDFLRAKQAHGLRAGPRNAWIEVVLDEGKNRHIRRMLEHLGIEVLRLVRVSVGPIALENLAKGACRHLTAGEKSSLDRAMAENLAGQKRGKRTRLRKSRGLRA